MENFDSPRLTSLHQSLTHPNQLFGADRELVLFGMLAAVIVAMSLGTLLGLSLAVVFWIALVAALKRMGKADPLMRQVYVRHIAYRRYYPAKSGLYSVGRQVPRGWR